MKPTLESEIALARQAGVGHANNMPFLLTPDKPGRHGVLLVHGFAATPHEMRDLANFLCDHNFTVMVVRLPGHGTSPSDLAKRSAEEWLAATERGYRILAEMDLKISAVGLSTGSLLAMLLSLRCHLERLVLLAPYLKLKHPLAAYAGLLSPFILYQKRDISAESRDYYYQKRPLKGIAQLNRLRKQVGRHINRIETPSLVLTSTGDQTISPGTAKELYQRLPGRNKTFHSYGEEVPHVLATAENPMQQDVFQRTLAFLRS